MKKSTLIAVIALLVSIAGLMIALIAYFKKRSCSLCDDLEDDMVELYDDEDDDTCGDCCNCDAAAEQASDDAPGPDEDLKF
ncbi:MAG: hypothetical protein RR022_08320 [Angelakisella sp.]